MPDDAISAGRDTEDKERPWRACFARMRYKPTAKLHCLSADPSQGQRILPYGRLLRFSLRVSGPERARPVPATAAGACQVLGPYRPEQR